MQQTGSAKEKTVFGLYELSDDGTILYSRSREGDSLREANAGSIGQDFFRDIFKCQNIEDLRRHFRSFIAGDRPVDTFTFDCLYESEVIRAKVFMTRAFENDRSNIVIMDIRQAS